MLLCLLDLCEGSDKLLHLAIHIELGLSLQQVGEVGVGGQETAVAVGDHHQSLLHHLAHLSDLNLKDID